MTELHHCLLPDRAILTVAGAEARSFLQGMISNDMNKVAPNRAVWAAFLTPQGKYLYDFFVVQAPDTAEETFYLDCEAGRAAEFKKKLSLYKLRSKVTITDARETLVAAVAWNSSQENPTGHAEPFGGGVAYTDPRLANAGQRFIVPANTASDLLTGHGSLATPAQYDAHRIALGLPDGSRDLMVDKSILLENGFEELHGVDWEKGCYIGQELTARTKYRGLIKRRLVPVSITGTAPASGTVLTDGEKDVGEMRSVQGALGLALIKIDAVEAGTPLTGGTATITPNKPAWAAF